MRVALWGGVGGTARRKESGRQSLKLSSARKDFRKLVQSAVRLVESAAPSKGFGVWVRLSPLLSVAMEPVDAAELDEEVDVAFAEADVEDVSSSSSFCANADRSHKFPCVRSLRSITRSTVPASGLAAAPITRDAMKKKTNEILEVRRNERAVVVVVVRIRAGRLLLLQLLLCRRPDAPPGFRLIFCCRGDSSVDRGERAVVIRVTFCKLMFMVSTA